MGLDVSKPALRLGFSIRVVRILLQVGLAKECSTPTLETVDAAKVPRCKMFKQIMTTLPVKHIDLRGLLSQRTRIIHVLPHASSTSRRERVQQSPTGTHERRRVSTTRTKRATYTQWRLDERSYAHGGVTCFTFRVDGYVCIEQSDYGSSSGGKMHRGSGSWG